MQRVAGTTHRRGHPTAPHASLCIIRAEHSLRITGGDDSQGGWNLAALVALALGVLPTLPGFLYTVKVISSCHPAFLAMYDVAWFVGVGVSTAAYCLLMSAGSQPQELGSAGAAA